MTSRTVKLGYNEHSVITNKYLGKIGHFSTQIYPVITKPGYTERNGRSRVVLYNRVWLTVGKISFFMFFVMKAYNLPSKNPWTPPILKAWLSLLCSLTYCKLSKHSRGRGCNSYLSTNSMLLKLLMLHQLFPFLKRLARSKMIWPFLAILLQEENVILKFYLGKKINKTCRFMAIQNIFDVFWQIFFTNLTFFLILRIWPFWNCLLTNWFFFYFLSPGNPVSIFFPVLLSAISIKRT